MSDQYTAIKLQGNDNIAALLANKPRQVLRIDMQLHTNGEQRYQVYDDFKMSGASNKYKLDSIGSSSGTAGLIN